MTSLPTTKLPNARAEGACRMRLAPVVVALFGLLLLLFSGYAPLKLAGWRCAPCSDTSAAARREACMQGVQEQAQAPKQPPPKQPEQPPPKQPCKRAQPAQLRALQDRLLAGGYERVLPPEALYRGVQLLGQEERLQRFGAKLLSGQPVVVGVLGGSITAGGGSWDAPYPSRYLAWLNDSFPHPGHRLKNAGLGGAGPPLFAFCVDHFAPQDADLVVLEFASNAQVKVDPDKSVQYQQAEQLVRSLLRLPSAPPVAFLHHYAWWWAGTSLFGKGGPGGVYYNSAEDNLSLLAQYYDCPILSIRRAAYHLMRQRAPGFKLDALAKDMAPRDNLTLQQPPTDLYYYDPVHPSPVGHQALADLLVELTRRAVGLAAEAAEGEGAGAAAEGELAAGGEGGRELGNSSSGSGGSSEESSSSGGGGGGGGSGKSGGSIGGPKGCVGGGDASPLPPPMTPIPGDPPPTQCLILEKFQGVVVSTGGDFAYAPARPEAPSFILQKWAWTGSSPGSWAELELDIREATGAAAAAGGGGGGAQAAAAAGGEEGGQAAAAGGGGSGGGNSSSGGESSVAGGEAVREAQVMLGHLKSYEGHGLADVACVSGCACAPSQINATWADRVTLMQMHVFQAAALPGQDPTKCRVRVSISPQDTGSGGHKISLVFAMVAQADAKLKNRWQPEQLEKFLELG